MNKDPVSRYCRRVGRHLRCTRAHRAELLGGLAEELRERRLPASASMKELYAAFGKPKDTALQLQESLDETEVKAAQARFKRKYAVIAAALVLVLGISAFLYYQHVRRMVQKAKNMLEHRPAYYTERIDIITGGETEDEGIIWGPVETAPQQ